MADYKKLIPSFGCREKQAIIKELWAGLFQMIFLLCHLITAITGLMLRTADFRFIGN